MLIRLRVNNLALVEDITLEFGEGFNVITGETGAGKSVLIGALNLLTGQKADRSAIRDPSRDATAEAEFYFDASEDFDAFLSDLGLPPLEEGQLILRRIIKAKGSSSCLINDQSVTLTALRGLGELLIDLHGPHDHQSLFQPGVQRDILDDFGKHRDARGAYEELYRDIQELDGKIEALEAADDDAAQVDLLTYRIQELEEADLKVDEESEIEQEHAVAGSAMEILELGANLNQLLLDGEPSTTELLSETLRHSSALTKLYPNAESWHEELSELADRLQEIGRDIERTLSSMDADPERMAELDARLTTYQKLKRKYRRSVPEMLEWLDESREQLHALQHREEHLADLKQKRENLSKKAMKAGKELSHARSKSGTRLAEDVTAEIQALGFADGAFDVEVQAGELGPHGIDTIEFGFAPNLGEPMRPLRQIASSGEMSRVLLAVKSVLARHDRVPVLVFDEIDANVGGEIGSAVGRKLKDVARLHQVICITHLPQVAIFGNCHYAISKHVRQARTVTEARPLNKEERVEEVARMLGGKAMSSVTLDHARQLLDQSA